MSAAASRAEQRTDAIRQVLGPLVWFALVSGLVEGLIQGSSRLFDRFAWVGVETVWTAPFVDLALFCIPAGLLVLVAAIRPRTALLGPAAVVFAYLGIFGLLALFLRMKLEWWALALLALGMAVQVGRMVAKRPDGFRRLTRRTTPWLAAAVVLLALTTTVGSNVAQRIGYATAPEARRGTPNLILIILDTVRARSLSLYGFDARTTPRLERWARRGVVFDRAIATSSWTLTSHASMFTGEYPHRQSSGWRTPLDDTYPTVAERLANEGYATGGFVANLIYAHYETGLDRGFQHYEDYDLSLRQILFNSSLGQMYDAATHGHNPLRPDDGKPMRARKTAREVTDGFLAWERDRDQPYFAFLNYFDAHGPYFAPRSFKRLFALRRAPMRNYLSAIAYIDYEVDRLLRTLERRGDLDNTVVIIASDHGEMFGEHGLWGHANSLYLNELHVPLVMFGPGVPRGGKRFKEPVSLVDLAATMDELTGGGAEMPGTSLTRFWASDASRRGSRRLAGSPLLSELPKGIRTDPELPVSRGDMESLIRGNVHYIRNGDGVEELFRLDYDPFELRNLAGLGEGKALLQQLRSALGSALRRRSSPAQHHAGKGTKGDAGI